MSKKTSVLISMVIVGVVGLILNYIMLPAWNLHSVTTWGFAGILLVIFVLCISGCAEISYNGDFEATVAFVTMVIGVAIAVIAMLIGSVFFSSRRYADIISYEEANFANDMEPVTSVSNIALMDTESAKMFGERTLGELSDIVSQYDLDTDYTQINLDGKPMKVSALEYDSFWKWNKNKDKGIPGYVLVDPVNNSAEYVKLDDYMKYSPSAYFHNDLKRTLRRQYPSLIFGETYFEIDEEKNPYWVVSVVEPTIGVFYGKVIKGAVILDPVTGKSDFYSVEEIPEWVDVVFDGDYICKLFNWNGLYKNGFWNSLLSKTGCKRCTNDYGYVTIDNDIWIYTGVTSASEDASNIGVILANERTGEIKYYNVSGADEASAMAAAEGEVQQYGYEASFPSIINVNGEPTYIMVLTDSNHIVKSYAMVNVANYSKVVVSNSQQEVFANYAKLMGFELEKEVVEEESVDTAELLDVTFVVANIEFIVNDGNTTVYIYANDDRVFKSKFDEFWILAKPGETINAKYSENVKNDAIIALKAFEK